MRIEDHGLIRAARGGWGIRGWSRAKLESYTRTYRRWIRRDRAQIAAGDLRLVNTLRTCEARLAVIEEELAMREGRAEPPLLRKPLAAGLAHRRVRGAGAEVVATSSAEAADHGEGEQGAE